MSDTKTEVKISISLKDLIALLGGTEQATLELRQGIAQTFSDKYLKGVVTDEVLTNAKKLAKDAIDTEFGVGTYRNGAKVLELQERFKKYLTTAFDDCVEEVVGVKPLKALVRERYNAAVVQIQEQIDSDYKKLMSDVEGLLVRAVDAEVARRIERGVDEKLEALRKAIK
jgi:hypothetical protein